MRAYLAAAPGAGSVMDIAISDLPAAPMLVRVEYSDLNYKDALAITGKSPILRSYPIVPGIDLAGEVVEDASGAFQPGEKVVAIGHGMGEDRWGGYSEFARIQPEAALPMPEGLGARKAMALGTAGLTAALSWLEIQRTHSLKRPASDCLPDASQERDAPGSNQGELRVLVTGATGGVGSVASMLLAAQGCYVIASTGRPEMESYFRYLGVKEVIGREALSAPGRPMEKQRWDAAIDTVGGPVLNGVLRSTAEGGVVAACGMAGGPDFTASVFPFILRSVRLVGIHSYFPPRNELLRAWKLLANTIDFAKLDAITTEIGLEELGERSQRMLENRTHGRTVVRVAGER